MPVCRDEAQQFSARILAWYDHSGRHGLPWKHPATSYRVWVSEIMLQQTQVSVVVPYFERFIARFPDVATLAAAPQDEVLALWAGLGYYARARNLHRAAQQIVSEHDGVMPARREAWEALPGVGRSTAGAIVSLSTGQRHAILDGNIKRVLTRYGAVPGWPGRSAVVRALWQWSEALTPKRRCADYNQAMMDLGATICTRRAPACTLCPVSGGCRAYAQGEAEAYPEPRPARRMPVRHTRMVLLESERGLLLQRRPPTGIWGGLWSLPECPVDEELAAYCREELGLLIEPPVAWPSFRHTFSHYHLEIQPVHARLADSADRVMTGPETIWYNGASMPGRGVAAPVNRLLQHWQRGA
ncbi:A/G-specific adenine glycosylase [Aquisalimonas sp.]|uniref:A/G-specific adenine glycosylase n=1 Tax=Aquisalimonas sp. TaxID=1872621 RepID=UPI0025BA5D19|nr:A/G-specific adenine glycosylase [Aquisalimonas sp.]